MQQLTVNVMRKLREKNRCAEKEKTRKYRENRDDHRILLERENDRERKRKERNRNTGKETKKLKGEMKEFQSFKKERKINQMKR